MSAVDEDLEAERLAEQMLTGNDELRDRWNRGEDSQATEEPTRFVPGGSFVLDRPPGVPAIWGGGDEVLMAKSEPTLIVGPPGTGKTTLIGQLVRGLVGLDGFVLGFSVTPTDKKVLYLASDRPEQIARSLGRIFTAEDRQVLDEKLVVWKGPPAHDLAAHTDALLTMACQAGASVVVIDSLKDMAVGIAKDEVGAGLNTAIQKVIAAGIDVIALHHQRKGQNGEKPKTLEDVYGSTWITAGAGSVLLLWGKAGDLVVDLVHLKSPSNPVGPLKIEHDHDKGISTVVGQFDAEAWLRFRRDVGGTARDCAQAMTEKSTPTDADRKRAQRALERLISRDRARKEEADLGGVGGSTGARYYYVAPTDQAGS